MLPKDLPPFFDTIAPMRTSFGRPSNLDLFSPRGRQTAPDQLMRGRAAWRPYAA